ncbi:MAG: transposase [Trueperaceae bacterium]|nr:transposase [Trueperaceae bacterium]
MAKRYSSEYKQEVVRLYRESGKGFRKLAEELGVSAYSIRKWVRDAEVQENPQAVEESAEIRRLKRENRVLREEREILRKAAAFFATDDRSTR